MKYFIKHVGIKRALNLIKIIQSERIIKRLPSVYHTTLLSSNLFSSLTLLPVSFIFRLIYLGLSFPPSLPILFYSSSISLLFYTLPVPSFLPPPVRYVTGIRAAPARNVSPRGGRREVRILVLNGEQLKPPRRQNARSFTSCRARDLALYIAGGKTTGTT